MTDRNDDVLDALRDARPPLDASSQSPHTPAAHRLMTRAIAVRRRPLWIKAAPAIAVTAAVALFAVTSTSTAPTGRRGGDVTQLRDVDIARVAASTRDAYSTTGRAEVQTASWGIGDGERSTVQIAFAGSDLETTAVINPEGSRPFETASRVVDGEFYLWDGPIGDKYWVHVVNESADAKQAFNADPRALLEMLDPGAEFEVVGERDGIRHLRATSVEDVPELSLGFGPAGGDDVTNLEIWVDENDVAHRFAIAFESTHSWHTGTLIVPFENGEPGRKIPDPSSPKKTATSRATVDIRFFDLGADIVIEAPADAAEVEGQG